MAFIREFLEDEAVKQMRNRQFQKFNTKLSGLGGAVSSSDALRGISKAPSAGKAPLLADYLKANVGSKMAQTAYGKVKKEGEEVASTEWQPTAEGTVVPITPTSEESAQYNEEEASLKGKAAPTQAEMIAAATQKAKDVEASAQSLGSQSGREAYLMKEYGKGQRYTPGEASLDAAIMGGLAGQQLGGLAEKYGKLYEQLTGRQAAAQKTYDDYRKEVAAREEARPKPQPMTVMVDPEQVKKDQAFLKAEQYRKEDAPLEAARGKGKGPWTLSREQLANRAGMTLEQWILAGEPEL